MPFLTLFLSPINLLFFIVVTGFAIGKIRIKGISLGIAGILFVSIFVGFLINLLASEENAEIVSIAQSTMKTLSKLGTSLFVSVIGLQTGFSIKENSQSSIFAFVIGALMSISGVATMLLISVLDNTISYPSLLGILCGALTSTPGLSSVCDLMDYGNEDAVWGYGCSYLLGVILTVVFAQIFSQKELENGPQSRPPQERRSKIYPELMLIGVVALLGNILGSVKIEFWDLSFGSTASTLLLGLIMGCLINKKMAADLVSEQCLNAFRTLGLALFFTGTGFSTGLQNITFSINAVLYGGIITLASLLCGTLLCTICSPRFQPHKSFIVSGGMTSSPAYGTIGRNATEASISCFSFAYFGALISLMFAIQAITR
jgi:AspT/YidE/YbjL antiporter-like protein